MAGVLAGLARRGARDWGGAERSGAAGPKQLSQPSWGLDLGWPGAWRVLSHVALSLARWFCATKDCGLLEVSI